MKCFQNMIHTSLKGILLYAFGVFGEVKNQKNRFVPECHSGKYRVQEIEEYHKYLNDPDTVWGDHLDHQWGGLIYKKSLNLDQ